MIYDHKNITFSCCCCCRCRRCCIRESAMQFVTFTNANQIIIQNRCLPLNVFQCWRCNCIPLFCLCVWILLCNQQKRWMNGAGINVRQLWIIIWHVWTPLSTSSCCLSLSISLSFSLVYCANDSIINDCVHWEAFGCVVCVCVQGGIV